MRTDLVYFVRAVGTDLVKIGVSYKPYRRRSVAQSWCPYPAKFLHIITGGLAEERAFHAMFKEFHAHREWYRLSDDQLAAVLPGFPNALYLNADRRRKVA